MKMWLARSKYGFLYLYKKEPVLLTYDRVALFYSEEEYFEIDNDLFPEVTFENSPQQVEIKLIENE